MSPLLINVAAIGLYLCASITILALATRKQTIKKASLTVLIAAAVVAHANGLYSLMVAGNSIDLAIHNMASLVILVINTLVLFSSIKKPLHNLFVLLFPLSIAAIVFSLLLKESSPHFASVTKGVMVHILLSVVAYSLLAIASLQALLWGWQSTQIKKHRPMGTTNLLPPLQTMELLMFEMLWAGVILLTAAIAVGLFYLKNIFDQHLVHKTVLSIFAWCVFTGLLWGRHSLGWRGNTAVKWILSGFCLLMLGYFGSKVVLELIINNH
ncbi:MAG: ABC-type uncharacterized transport system permease subunit [Cellvibrionaceae bacterium]|jgi:ABC-type uncharacterized transport system permease subunit